MKYKQAVKRYIEACVAADITTLEVEELASKERGGGWHLRAHTPGSPGLTQTVCLISPAGETLVGLDLARWQTNRQMQNISANDWITKTLPELKKSHGVE